MKLKHTLWALALAGASFSALANNEVRRADLVADCDGWGVEILTQNTAECPQYNVCYTINVDPVAGGAPVMGCLPSGGPNTLRVRNADGVWAPPLDGVFDVSGTLEIVDLDPACNPVGPINKTVFNGGVPITLVCDVPEPDIDLVKEVSVDGGATYVDANDAASAAVTTVGSGALYQLTVTNIGAVDLENVVINDPVLQISNYLVGMLAVGETRILDSGIIPELNAADVCDVPGTVVNVADVSGDPVTGGDPVTDSDPANVRCDEQPGGGEGCTPGYWRQPHHYDSWVGYTPDDLYSDVFGVGPADPLGETVKAKGGGENALLRHSTAALLNAANSGVDFGFTVAEVIALVGEAYASGDFEAAKDVLAEENELGCPLN